MPGRLNPATPGGPARLAAWLLLGLLALPQCWSLWQALQAGMDAQGWQALWQDRQTRAALGLSLWTGLASSLLALAACATLLAHSSRPAALQGLLRHQAVLLALPHAAFAIGLVLWIAPSGWLLRLLSPWATGLHAPPPWPTTQDPWGLGLIVVLAFKETPFLLWAAGTQLLRPDVAQRLLREQQVAASLGYAPRAAWWRIVWPQLLPRLAAPLLAVLAYGLTVVDVAQIIGPATPPTLAVLGWSWLRNPTPEVQAMGAAAAWTLALGVALCAALGWALLRAPLWRHWISRGVPRATRSLHTRAPAPGLGALRPGLGLWLLGLVYGAVLLALALGSVMGLWPFPALLPRHWSLAAWAAVADSASSIATTLWLAASSAACALLWVVAWLEWAPPAWQRRTHALAYGPLLLPGLLWAIGLYRLALDWGLDGQATGLWLAHTLACLPYVLLSCSAAYQGFDARMAQLAATLGCSRWAFVWQVKWPLLRAPLALAFAVGFAVSVAQYLPTLYVGAGRFSSVTTEAVALAAGGQRDLMAAFAWLQWLLPACVFVLAAGLGRPRRFAAPARLGTMRA